MVESDLRLAAVTNICHPALVVVVVIEAVVLFNIDTVVGSISSTTSRNLLSQSKIHRTRVKVIEKE